ncbi:hypothetical protein [Actinomycetospora sp.]|jgi:hypothetical protein|uniref:hypothetical protein n=1 Tax=Actinomycetospora sp. TaxID=1872135 RepID=UPI002F3F4F0F
MARSRHGRSRSGSSSTDSGLPSWAQRHLDEAGDATPAEVAPTATLSSHRRASAAEPSRLRGWGVAIVSVAAAVGAVPLAITSLANDSSDDPLPKVDTYTAGSPASLPAENGADGGAARRTAPGAVPGTPGPVGSDPATAGVLVVPPVAAAPIVPARAAPTTVVPAAVVQSSPTVAPTTTPKATTPRSATPTTSESTEQSRSATKPPSSKPAAPKPSTKPQAPASKAPAPSRPQGLLPSVVHSGEKAVNGVVDTAGSLVGGL